MPQIRIYFLLTFLVASMGLCMADEAPRFIPATLENTTLEGGVALEIVANDPEHPHQLTRGPQPPANKHRWHWWKTNRFACFATHGEEGSDAPVLRTLVSGLRPNANYQVDGFFRAEGGKQPPHPIRGDIRMGFTIARTEAYGPLSGQGLSCIIGVDHPSGRVTRMDSRPTDDPDFPLFRVSLGIARSDADGTIIVFIDDQPNDTLSAATLYEGVAIAPADDNARPVAGTGSAQDLVEAVRVDDRETIDRELAAGADLNTPDREGLTALFYACLAGDHDLAVHFLNAGAMPDPAGQRLPPLWAASSNGDVKLTSALLQAGAEITTTCLSARQSSALIPHPLPTKINPVSAAFLAGSIDTVKVLLAHKPDIDLGKAVFHGGWDYIVPEGPEKSPPKSAYDNLIRLSMDYGNLDMIRWLIERGHDLKLTESRSLPVTERWTNQYGARSIMIFAIMRDQPRMDLVAALVDRGVPLIVSDDFLFKPIVVPWDGLSAAVFAGHFDLVRDWLPMAESVGSNYQSRLVTLAHASGCTDSLRLVEQAFPNLPPPRYQQTKHEVIAARGRLLGDASGFVPRTKASGTRRVPGDVLRIVILGTGAAAGPADALAAIASKNPSIIVVEREKLAAALAERTLAPGHPLSAAQLNELGDILRADVIVTATSFGNEPDSVLQFEAHEVRTGLTRHRMFHATKGFDPEPFADGFLAGLRSKLEISGDGKSLVAITLLTIAPELGFRQGGALTATLRAGLLQEIDSSGGMVALTRDQLAPLLAERAFGGEENLWGAAWTIEGGLRQATEPGHVALTLRLRSNMDDSKTHDILVEGSVTDPIALVRLAWAELSRHITSGAIDPKFDPAHAEHEADRLAREAEWLLKTPLAWQAGPIADAALYLGGNRLDRLMLRLECHWAASHVINPLSQWESFNPFPIHATGYPLARDIHPYYLYWLEEHLELLRLTRDTLEETIAKFRAGGRHDESTLLQPFWQNAMRLTEFRCRLVPALMNSEQKNLISGFDAKLRQLWETVVSHRPGHFTGKAGENFSERFASVQRSTMNFRQLPWLGGLLADELLATTAGAMQSRQDKYTYGLSSVVDQSERFIYPCPDAYARTLMQALERNPQHADLRRAEIQFIRSTDIHRLHAARSVSRESPGVFASRLYPPVPIIKFAEHALRMPTHGFGSRSSIPSQYGMPLPSLVAAPRDCVDMQYRSHYYHFARYHFAHSSTSPGDRGRIADYMAARFDTALKTLAHSQEPAAAFDLLLAAAQEADELYGTNIKSRIEPSLQSMGPTDAPVQTFGATGGFRFASQEDPVVGDLLADLKSDFPGDHAFIVLHAVDPGARHLLWLVVQPLPEKEIETQVDQSRHWELLRVDHPWLLCIDCRDGSVLHRINLVKAAFDGTAPQFSTQARLDGSFENHIEFNDESILLLIRWKLGVSINDRILVIRRKDGQVLNNTPYNSILYKSHSDGLRGLAGVGKYIAGLGRDFYLLANDDKSPRRMQKHGVRPYQIWKLSPNADLVRLSLFGRRPAVSPFDAENREPLFLQADAGKILVASSFDFAAHYDPNEDRWSESRELSGEAFARHARRLNKQANDAMFNSQHLFQLNDNTNGRFAPHDESEPGSLVYNSTPKTSRRLPVSLPVPSHYPGAFLISPMPAIGVADVALHLKEHPLETINIETLAKSDMVRPAILNQTEDYLIIGSKLMIPRSIIDDKYSRVHLPYLWRITKKEARERMLREEHIE